MKDRLFLAFKFFGISIVCGVIAVATGWGGGMHPRLVGLYLPALFFGALWIGTSLIGFCLLIGFFLQFIFSKRSRDNFFEDDRTIKWWR